MRDTSPLATNRCSRSARMFDAIPDVQLAGFVPGELAVRRHVSQCERLERGEELLGGPTFLMRAGLPDAHHVQAVVVRAGRPAEQAVDVLGRLVLSRDLAEVLDGTARTE